jgi:hypothetical protein
MPDHEYPEPDDEHPDAKTEPEKLLPKHLQDWQDRRNFGVTWEEFLAEHEEE